MPETTPEAARVPGQGNWPRCPQDLPHGFLKPPQEVMETLAREKAKFPAEIFGREFEELTLNEWTVDYIFGHQRGYQDEVLYRPTPEGPEVLAVGFEEILSYTKDMPTKEQLKLKTWVPW